MLRHYGSAVLLTITLFLLPFSGSFGAERRGPPNYETRYANCWVNFEHVVDQHSFGEESGSVGGTALINKKAYRFSSSWEATSIPAFGGNRPSGWSLIQGLVYCLPKRTVTATRRCSPMQRGSTGSIACDVCIGEHCKRIRAVLTFSPL